MDSNQKIATSSPTSDIATDLEHINHEMYKKNVELAERNKTLSLLRKIDSIILSSVTDPQEIARHVASLLTTDAGFKTASISLIQEKRLLVRLAYSEAESVMTAKKEYRDKVVEIVSIPLTLRRNILVQSVDEKQIKTTNNLYDLSVSDMTFVEAKTIQEAIGVTSFIIYPFTVREQVIGTMSIGLSEDAANLTEFQKDLLNRLSSVIGIALDNALLYNEVQNANAKLKALDKLKDEFVSVASHELRTPMTAIKSYLWMTLAGKGGNLTEKQKYYIDRAYNATDRLIRLVNDMLNISRIESGRITLEMQSVNMTLLVQEIVEEITPRAQELQIAIEVDAEKDLPNVLADPNKIKEVLINLIGNSLKFTPAKGKISLILSLVNGMVQTKVQDTGSGIEKEDVSKLFHKFALIEGSYAQNQSTQGTGLGLYICKSIIELHEGKIWAESEGRGKGSIFIFTLKVLTQEEQHRLAKTINQVSKEAVGLVHTAV